MDAVQAFTVLEESLRGKDGYLGPEEYSAICSLKSILKSRQKRINKLKKGWKK